MNQNFFPSIQSTQPQPASPQQQIENFDDLPQDHQKRLIDHLDSVNKRRNHHLELFGKSVRTPSAKVEQTKENNTQIEKKIKSLEAACTREEVVVKGDREQYEALKKEQRVMDEFVGIALQNSALVSKKMGIAGSYRSKYFEHFVSTLRKKMITVRHQIEDIHNSIVLRDQQQIQPSLQMLQEAIQNQQEVFHSLAAKVASLSEEVQECRQLSLELFKTDIFEEKSKPVSAPQRNDQESLGIFQQQVSAPIQQQQQVQSFSFASQPQSQQSFAFGSQQSSSFASQPQPQPQPQQSFGFPQSQQPFGFPQSQQPFGFGSQQSSSFASQPQPQPQQSFAFGSQQSSGFPQSQQSFGLGAQPQSQDLFNFGATQTANPFSSTAQQSPFTFR